MIFSASHDRFTTGLTDGVLRPRILKSKNPVVYCVSTGLTITGEQLNEPGIRYVMRGLVEEGYVVVCPTSPNLWGNPVGRSHIDDALTYARDVLGQVGPAILTGYSQGGVPALSWAMNNPNDTVCVIGFKGATDLNDIRDRDVAGQKDDIESAYGIGPADPLPVGVNPFDRADEFQTIPTQWWYADDDPLIVPSIVEAFGAAAGTELHSFGSGGGHTVDDLETIDIDDLLGFIETATG